MNYLLLMFSESKHFCFADYGVSSYDIGTGFGHFAISTQDVSRPTLSFKYQESKYACDLERRDKWPFFLGFQTG